MSKRHRSLVSVGIPVTLAVVVAASLTMAFLSTRSPQALAREPRVTGSAQSATITNVTHHTTNMAAVHVASAAQLQQAAAHELRSHTRLNAQAYAQAKIVAKRSAPRGDSGVGSLNANLSATFAGIQSSASICPPVGCNPPDMGLATSPNWVLQGANTSYAVFDSHGHIQPGWPKTFADFFGVPNPGACAGNVPFTSDPRIVYDPNDDRFVAAALELEGSIANSCPLRSIYYIAVSQTNNPNGAWNIYTFDMTLGTTNIADFTMIGFDSRAVYFSANMFNEAGTAYEYAEIFAADKSRMEAGQDVVGRGFFNLTVTGPAGGFLVDTVQPVQTEARGRGPISEFFVDTFNGFDPVSGHFCSSASDACQGLALWAFSSPNATPQLTFRYVGNTRAYTFAPSADQTTCTQCVDSSDLRISATPVYRDGFIYAAWETGVDNGTQVVPGILWSQVAVEADGGQITTASQVHGSYFYFGGDDAVVYPALMPNADGTLFMVFDRMGSTVNPEVRLAATRTGTFRTPGVLIKAGEGPYRPTRCGHDIPVCRWGDFSATSYDGFRTDRVSFGGQYANAGGFSRNWGTWLGIITSAAE